METIHLARHAALDFPPFLPRICRANLALPSAIMLQDCLYCRRQLVRAAGCMEKQERLFDHLVNLDCSGAVAMRKEVVGKR